MNSKRPVRPQNNIKRYSQNEIFANTFNKPNEKEQDLKNQEENLNNSNLSKNHSEHVNNSKMILAVTKDSRLPLNVEDLLIQEDKLYKILDNIRIKVNSNFSAEEYLEFSHITSIQTFEIFFSDEKFIFQINCAQIYEFLSAILATFLYLTSINNFYKFNIYFSNKLKYY